MISLNKLRLHFNAIRFTMIDGINLNENIVRYLSNLHTFVFDICTILPRSPKNSFLSTADLEKTFTHWNYCPVNCSVDHFSTGLTYCHMYSIPYRTTHFMYFTNTIRNQNPCFTTISYNELVLLRLIFAHIDYAYQFLHHTKAHVPQLRTIDIRYDKLITVTNNFTNPGTKVNCSQVKQIRFEEILVYPEHFHDYFPSLSNVR